MGKPKFYDFCVHAAPDGDNTIEELASLARHFGYSGIALTNHSDRLPDKKPALPLELSLWKKTLQNCMV